jgi:lipoprotein-anchoring transpeptidase ErfK/SrfK
MRNRDVMELFDQVHVDDEVIIQGEEPSGISARKTA